MNQDDELLQAFLEEANDLLEELENALLELEEKPEDMEHINRVFRAMHTIKGSGSMLGFEVISDFSHKIENAFDRIRNGQAQVNRAILDLTLEAKDHIYKMVSNPENQDEDICKQIIKNLEDTLGQANQKSPSTRVDQEEQEENQVNKIEGIDSTYRIRFKPSKDILVSGKDPLSLLEELQNMGRAQVIAHPEELPDFKELDSKTCYIWWDIIITTDKSEQNLREVFVFVEDDSEIDIQLIDQGSELEDEEKAHKRLGEILVERGDLKPEQLQEVLVAKEKPIGEILSEQGLVSEQTVQSALAEQKWVQKNKSQKQQAESTSSIRVSVTKLDKLVDLVGELVIAQARLRQIVNEKDEQVLTSIAEEIERLSDELRDNTLNIRMVPIGTTFSHFKRLVRDLSQELGKEVVLKTEGGETELDKTMIEHLKDPLMHIIRNGIDHGIEKPEVRESQGKPRRGTLKLSAIHSGANVLIEISDDGGGLDKEAIRAKAIDKGLISSDAELSDNEIFDQIFRPGFSTAIKATDVSGRGVGMDVVKSSIESLRGSISLNSQKHLGTKMTLQLPLTLAIIDGLLVVIDKTYFVIPLSSVDECVELFKKDIEKGHGRNIINVRGEIVPFIYLRDFFQIKGEPPEIEQVVIAEIDGYRIGFVVDQIIGEYQTVIKRLGKMFKRTREFSGATILADGTVGLILDVHKLAAMAEQEEQKNFIEKSSQEAPKLET